MNVCVGCGKKKKKKKKKKKVWRDQIRHFKEVYFSLTTKFYLLFPAKNYLILNAVVVYSSW